MPPDQPQSPQEWVPQPLPEDDALAHQPVDVPPRDLVPDLAPGLLPGPAPDVLPGPAADPVPAPAPSLLPSPAPAPAAVPDGAPPAPAVPDDAPLPAEVALLHTDDPTSPDERRSWTGVLVGAALVPFFVAAPVVVLRGDVLGWLLAYLAGATLMVAGGIPASRTVLSRGTGRPLPLTAFVVGAVTVVACVVVAVVRAQG